MEAAACARLRLAKFTLWSCGGQIVNLFGRIRAVQKFEFAPDSPLEERVSSEPVSEIGSDSGAIMGDSGS